MVQREKRNILKWVSPRRDLYMLRLYIYIYVYIYIYTRWIRCLQTFFVWAFKIVVDFWKFSMLLLYILWDDWPIFMISGSIEHLQKELEYTLLKLGCHSWWISKMQSDTLHERYAIKLYFKLGKIPQKRMECLTLLWTILHESGIGFWVA